MDGFSKIFSKVFCINLDTRTDRRKKISEQAIKYGIDLSFFVVNMHKNPRRGCLLSHMNIIKMARDQCLPNVLILEDDVQFVSNPHDLHELPAQWDMLYLGGNVQEVYKDPWHANWKRVSTFTTHAYAINCTIYDMLLEQLQQWIVDTDSGKIAYKTRRSISSMPTTFTPTINVSCATQSWPYRTRIIVTSREMVNYSPYIIHK